MTELDEAGKRDKFAAHQTLYTVMTTLCKLCAPIIPFLAEVMYQNLRNEADPESVHLAGVSVRGQTINEATLDDPDDALRFMAPDLMRDKSDD